MLTSIQLEQTLQHTCFYYFSVVYFKVFMFKSRLTLDDMMVYTVYIIHFCYVGDLGTIRFSCSSREIIWQFKPQNSVRQFVRFQMLWPCMTTNGARTIKFQLVSLDGSLVLKPKIWRLKNACRMNPHVTWGQGCVNISQQEWAFWARNWNHAALTFLKGLRRTFLSTWKRVCSNLK